MIILMKFNCLCTQVSGAVFVHNSQNVMIRNVSPLTDCAIILGPIKRRNGAGMLGSIERRNAFFFLKDWLWLQMSINNRGVPIEENGPPHPLPSCLVVVHKRL